MSSLAEAAAEAVRAVIEAMKRIPDWITLLYPGLTFFSHYDHWYYITIGDVKTCDDCAPRDTRTYYGDLLRLEFPWLEVEDANSIKPHVHPNCRCELLRLEWLLEKKVNL